MRYLPPFSGIEPGWEDSDGFAPVFTGVPDTSFDSGSQALNVGEDEVAVTFQNERPNANYDISSPVRWGAPGDAPESIFVTLVLVKSTTGFTVKLNSAPTVTGFILDWRVDF